jgi:hypothetical protein
MHENNVLETGADQKPTPFQQLARPKIGTMFLAFRRTLSKSSDQERG